MKVNAALSLALLATALAIASAPALAVDSDPSPPINNDHAAGKKAIEAKDWNGAIKLLTADEHLAALKRICPSACEERDDLMKSIERYRAGRK